MLQRQIAILRRAVGEAGVAAKATEERLSAQLREAQSDLRKAQKTIEQLEQDKEQASEEHQRQLDAERAAGRAAIAEVLADAAAQRGDLERKLRGAEAVAEHRTREFHRAHSALVSRMRLRPRDVVDAWGVDEQREALLALLQEHRRCLEALRPIDFQACGATVRRDLARKLLEAIKVASVSWLASVSELFGAHPADFYRRVASWYEQEGVVTDDVRYHQEVARLKGVIEGTDLAPLYAVLREAVSAGRQTLSDVVFQCSGKSAEETMLSVTGMSLEEVDAFRQNRAAVMRFLATRQSVEARERREAALRGGLGFLHHGAGGDPAAEPMDPARLSRLVAQVLSRKLVVDARAAAAGRARPNIMRVTRTHLERACATAEEAEAEVAQLVAGVRAHAEACPRLRVFGLLSGMDPDRPWLERAAGFVSAFLAGVVGALWADPALLADFARRNALVLPDAASAARLDRVAWALADRDVRVPAAVLLKAAMQACELHPCGCGYPRDRAQRLVDAACAPGDYAAAQEERGREARAQLRKRRAAARERAEDIRLDIVFHRLSRGRNMAAAVAAAAAAAAQREPPSDSGAEAMKRHPAELARLHDKIQRITAALSTRKGATSRPRAGLRSQDCGAAFEAGAAGWLDVFCRDLLLHWFEQRDLLEAQMIRLFDEFDLVSAGRGGEGRGGEGGGSRFPCDRRAGLAWRARRRRC